MQGDWGDIDNEDRDINEEALKLNLRSFSAYAVEPALRIWIITEADRSVTTVMLPEDY